MNSHLLISLLALQVVSVAYAFDSDFYDTEYVAPRILRNKIENKKANIGTKIKDVDFNMKRYQHLHTPEVKKSYYGYKQANLNRVLSQSPEKYLKETNWEWLKRKLHFWRDKSKMTPIQRIYWNDIKSRQEDLREAKNTKSLSS